MYKEMLDARLTWWWTKKNNQKNGGGGGGEARGVADAKKSMCRQYIWNIFIASKQTEYFCWRQTIGIF
jgi:hypothetical protein